MINLVENRTEKYLIVKLKEKCKNLTQPQGIIKTIRQQRKWFKPSGSSASIEPIAAIVAHIHVHLVNIFSCPLDLHLLSSLKR